MKLFIFCLSLVCLNANAQEMKLNNAMPLDNPTGSTCAVTLSDYYAGSVVMYTGQCGWGGLKGVAAYIQAWNHSNHIKIVRGVFNNSKAASWSKVTYINKVARTIETYEEDYWMTRNRKSYNYDNMETDARQAGLQLDFNKASAYLKFANYIDVHE